MGSPPFRRGTRARRVGVVASVGGHDDTPQGGRKGACRAEALDWAPVCPVRTTRNRPGYGGRPRRSLGLCLARFLSGAETGVAEVLGGARPRPCPRPAGVRRPADPHVLPCRGMTSARIRFGSAGSRRGRPSVSKYRKPRPWRRRRYPARCADCGKDAPDRLGSLLAHKAPSRALLAVLDRSTAAAGGTGGLGGPRRPRSGGVVRPSCRPRPMPGEPSAPLVLTDASLRTHSRRACARAMPADRGGRVPRLRGTDARRPNRCVPGAGGHVPGLSGDGAKRGAGPGPTAFADAAVRVARSVGRGPGSGPPGAGRGSQDKGEAGP